VKSRAKTLREMALKLFAFAVGASAQGYLFQAPAPAFLAAQPGLPVAVDAVTGLPIAGLRGHGNAAIAYVEADVPPVLPSSAAWPIIAVAAVTGVLMGRATARAREGRPVLSMLGVGGADAIKRGDKVRVMRPESYWFQETGTVATIAKGDDRYPVVVRLDKVNYAGVATNNFALDELVKVPGEQ